VQDNCCKEKNEQRVFVTCASSLFNARVEEGKIFLEPLHLLCIRVPCLNSRNNGIPVRLRALCITFKSRILLDLKEISEF